MVHCIRVSLTGRHVPSERTDSTWTCVSNVLLSLVTLCRSAGVCFLYCSSTGCVSGLVPGYVGSPSCSMSPRHSVNLAAA